jgi:hypothetical protein
MLEKEFERLITLDDAAEEAGGFVAWNPNSNKEPQYDYPALSKFCKEKNIDPVKLSQEEWARFLV